MTRPRRRTRARKTADVEAISAWDLLGYLYVLRFDGWLERQVRGGEWRRVCRVDGPDEAEAFMSRAGGRLVAGIGFSPDRQEWDRVSTFRVGG